MVGFEVREVTISWKACRLVSGWTLFYSKIENCWRGLGRGVTRCNLHFNEVSLTILLSRLRGAKGRSKGKKVGGY